MQGWSILIQVPNRLFSNSHSLVESQTTPHLSARKAWVRGYILRFPAHAWALDTYSMVLPLEMAAAPYTHDGRVRIRDFVMSLI